VRLRERAEESSSGGERSVARLRLGSHRSALGLFGHPCPHDALATSPPEDDSSALVAVQIASISFGKCLDKKQKRVK